MAGEGGSAGPLAWLRQYWPQLPTLVVALLTLLGVSTLSSRMSTSEMLVKQIEHLKNSDDIHRNVSILAIEHTLSSRSPVEGVHHDLLLAGNSEASRQRIAHIHRILREKLVELNPTCARRFDALADAGSALDFQSSETAVSAEEGLSGVITSGECRHAAAFGVWPLWWPSKATHDTVLRTSVLSLAEIPGTAVDGAQKPTSSGITEIELAAGAGTPGSLDVAQLSEDKLESASEIVAAAVVSDEEDREEAEKLRVAANDLVRSRGQDRGAGSPPAGWPIGSGEGLTDLSDWTLSAKLPRGQLELWWITAGDRCEAARAGREGAAG